MAREVTKFKTKPLPHQLRCLKEFGRFEAFMLAGEQGTGKTWIIINNIADLWASNDLNGVLVFAPSGVHYNWVLVEIPKHMPTWVRYKMAAWVANPSGPTAKADRRAMEELFAEKDSSVLRIFVMNVEALQNKRGIEAARRFASTCAQLMIVPDESSDFKNPSSGRTKELFKLRKFSRWRRCVNGTVIEQGPFDAFSQYSFLDESILGTTSYWAFKADYAQLLHKEHPLLKNIMKKAEERGRPMRGTPQIVARDGNDRPIYRNLAKLTRLIEPYTFRVLKKDMEGYKVERRNRIVWFDLTPTQWAAYLKCADEYRLALNGEDTPVARLAARMKLAQITSGYYIHPEQEEPVRIAGANPKLERVVDQTERLMEQRKKLIIWARFRVQIEDICQALRALKLENGRKLHVVEYHGGIPKRERPEVVKEFEEGSAEVFVGQQQAGGRGLTLVGAHHMFYFSNLDSAGMRWQSGDRFDRIGQMSDEVFITDFCARNTIDYETLELLGFKKETADTIMGPIGRRK
jgi:hypothetical protein